MSTNVPVHRSSEMFDVHPMVRRCDRRPWVSERREVRPRSGWAVVAVDYLERGGGRVWDVRAEHIDGSRIPAGPNCHDRPEAEMASLVRLIGPPGPAAGAEARAAYESLLRLLTGDLLVGGAEVSS